MTRLTPAEGFVWGAMLALLTAILAADILGNAGVLRPWTESHAAALSGILIIAAGLTMIWTHYAVTPIGTWADRRIGVIGYAILFVAMTHPALSLAQTIATEFYGVNWRPLVSSKLNYGVLMVMLAYTVWTNRKYTRD